MSPTPLFPSSPFSLLKDAINYTLIIIVPYERNERRNETKLDNYQKGGEMWEKRKVRQVQVHNFLPVTTNHFFSLTNVWRDSKFLLTNFSISRIHITLPNEGDGINGKIRREGWRWREVDLRPVFFLPHLLPRLHWAVLVVAAALTTLTNTHSYRDINKKGKKKGESQILSLIFFPLVIRSLIKTSGI